MLTLIHFALSAKFQGADVNGLVEVLNSTPYPDISTEIVLGVYKTPEFNLTVPDTENKANIKLVAFSPVTQQVTYSYNAKNTKYTVTKAGTGEFVKETSFYYSKEYMDNPEYSVEIKTVIETELRTSNQDLSDRDVYAWVK